ncbi:MAG: hypothetical protein JXB29_07290 [Sedimentisphaerales bacterium]|nr:hypothetical protein [Sedimentisphaerales bacterium]
MTEAISHLRIVEIATAYRPRNNTIIMSLRAKQSNLNPSKWPDGFTAQAQIDCRLTA